MENNKKSNTIAIVGFILSFFIAIPALICSIIGLKKSKELNNGKGFSIAGIIISSVKIALGILITALLILVYYVGDNIVVEESKNNKNNTTTTTTVARQIDDEKLDLYYNKVKADNTINLISKDELITNINFSEKFKNSIVEKDNNIFSFNCDEMEDSPVGDPYCVSYHILVNDTVKIIPEGQEYYITITDDRIIIQNYEQQTYFDVIKIYNKSTGDLLLNIDNSYFDLSFGLIKIFDNNLYYIGSTDKDVQNIKQLSTYKVDLINNTNTIVDTINYKK